MIICINKNLKFVRFTQCWGRVFCVTVFCMGFHQQVIASAFDYSLNKFLRSELSGSNGGDVDKSTRYSSSLINFGPQNSRVEILVYLTGLSWCGSGGCTLYVLDFEDNSYKIVGRTTIVKLPIRVLNSTTNGRPDIGVWVRGGGANKGYEAALPFDGARYAPNPTVLPSKPLLDGTDARVVINREDVGMYLYEKK